MCWRETWNVCGELIEKCCSQIIIHFFVLIFALIFALINIIGAPFQGRIVNSRECHYLQRQFQRLANHHLHITDKLSLPGTCLHQLLQIISTRQSIYLLASYNATKKKLSVRIHSTSVLQKLFPSYITYHRRNQVAWANDKL